MDISVDVLITGCLCYYLHRGRSSIRRYGILAHGEILHQAFSRTNSMVKKLMIFAINRGALTVYA